MDLDDFEGLIQKLICKKSNSGDETCKDAENHDHNALKELFRLNGLFRGGKMKEGKELAIDMTESTTCNIKRHASED